MENRKMKFLFFVCFVLGGVAIISMYESESPPQKFSQVSFSENGSGANSNREESFNRIFKRNAIAPSESSHQSGTVSIDSLIITESSNDVSLKAAANRKTVTTPKTISPPKKIVDKVRASKKAGKDKKVLKKTTPHGTTIESTTEETTVESTTTETTVESTTEETTVESTTEETTVESTTEETTIESTTEETTVESTTEETTLESTIEETTAESTTEGPTIESTSEKTTVELTTRGTRTPKTIRTTDSSVLKINPELTQPNDTSEAPNTTTNNSGDESWKKYISKSTSEPLGTTTTMNFIQTSTGEPGKLLEKREKKSVSLLKNSNKTPNPELGVSHKIPPNDVKHKTHSKSSLSPRTTSRSQSFEPTNDTQQQMNSTELGYSVTNANQAKHTPPVTRPTNQQAQDYELSQTVTATSNDNSTSVDIKIDIDIDVKLSATTMSMLNVNNNSADYLLEDTTISPRQKQYEKKRAVAGIILAVFISLSAACAILFVLLPTRQEIIRVRRCRPRDQVELIPNRNKCRPKFYDTSLYMGH